MNRFSQIHSLLMEAGPLLDAHEIVEYKEAKTWSILLQDFLVILEFDEENNVIHLSSVIEEAQAESLKKLQLNMLRYSSAQQRKRGFRVGCVEKDGAFVLIQSINATGFSSNNLYSELSKFLDEIIALRINISEQSKNPSPINDGQDFLIHL
ncbi:type III secretion system chaperone [Polycladidibacter hongkongensis]|uniref:type III secretion system chaperone n=1 Tax=Polycladidibacter hongkongensis TaxID=1647556 RepID=UPI0008328B49|nr:type III secretion system chaperone [Pseudovibrio hongkongensis]